MKKRTLRETLLDNQKAETMWARAYGVPIRADLPAVPEAKVRKIRTSAAMAAAVPTEHEEQRNFVKWFRLQYKQMVIWAVPNSAMRSMELASYLKAEGMMKGVPDLEIPALNLYIEFKRIKGGVISSEQQWMADYLIGIGKRHFFAYGCDDAINKLKEITNGEV